MDPHTPQPPQPYDLTLRFISRRWKSPENAALLGNSYNSATLPLTIEFTDFFLRFHDTPGLLDATRRKIEMTCGQERQLERIVWESAIIGLRETLIILGGEQALTRTRKYLEKKVLNPLQEQYHHVFEAVEHSSSIDPDRQREELRAKMESFHQSAEDVIKDSWGQLATQSRPITERIHERWRELVGGRISDDVEALVEHSSGTSADILLARIRLEQQIMRSAVYSDISAALDLLGEPPEPPTSPC